MLGLLPGLPARADTVYDGETARYGCIQEIDDAGLTLQVACNRNNVLRVAARDLRYFEFNEKHEGFSAAARLRSGCAPSCTCAQPVRYKVVQFAKGAGTIFASDIALGNQHFRFKNVGDNSWYDGPVDNVFSVTWFFQCPGSIPRTEVPSGFEKK
jgi:hypothetical protein